MLRGRMITVLLLPFLTLFVPLRAQDTIYTNYLIVKNEAEERYGPLGDLINGEKYNYTYRAAGGDPFFESDVTEKAAIQINGRMYEDQKVKYDIYNQLMVLEFISSSGAPESVVLRNEWLDFVMIGDRCFRQFPKDDGSPRFGQVIWEGEASCIYFWKKIYLLNLDAGGKNYDFSDPIRSSYVVKEGIFTLYKSKRSFLKCFAKQVKPAIKQYLKDHRIRIKKADDMEIASLMKFINQIPGNDN